MHSPNVTEMRIAAHEGSSPSMKIGKASLDIELKSNSVHSNKWCLLRSGRILLAAVFSSGVPTANLIWSFNVSIDSNPTVSPAAKAAIIFDGVQ